MHLELDRFSEFLVDGAGRALRITVPERLHPAAARLMASLGVEVNVVTASALTQTVTRCDRPHCTWNFVGTELRGQSFLETHLRLMHGGNGHTATADGKAALEVMDNGERQAPATKKPEVKGMGVTRTNHTWTREEILEAIRTFHRVNGRLPKSDEWIKRGDDHPARSTVAKHFEGSWSAAIEAAGFPRPSRGGSNGSSAVEPKMGEPGAVLSSPVPAAEPEERPTSVPPAAVLDPSPSPAATEAGSTAADVDEWLATLTLDRGGLQQEIYRLNTVAEQARSRSVLLSRFVEAIDALKGETS